jgi:hypothetical protein
MQVTRQFCSPLRRTSSNIGGQDAMRLPAECAQVLGGHRAFITALDASYVQETAMLMASASLDGDVRLFRKSQDRQGSFARSQESSSSSSL